MLPLMDRFPIATRSRLSRTPQDGGRHRGDWTLPEETVPESRSHDLTLDLLKALLVAWAARAGRNAQVGRNLAIRWEEHRPNTGADESGRAFDPQEGKAFELGAKWQSADQRLYANVMLTLGVRTT